VEGFVDWSLSVLILWTEKMTASYSWAAYRHRQVVPGCPGVGCRVWRMDGTDRPPTWLSVRPVRSAPTRRRLICGNNWLPSRPVQSLTSRPSRQLHWPSVDSERALHSARLLTGESLSTLALCRLQACLPAVVMRGSARFQIRQVTSQR